MIVSNKQNSTVQEINPEIFGDKIDFYLGEGEGSRKPSPDMLSKAMEVLSIGSERTIMVGDSEADMGAAQRAGVKTVAVTWGYRSESDLKELKPDYIIGKAEELLDLEEIR